MGGTRRGVCRPSTLGSYRAPGAPVTRGNSRRRAVLDQGTGFIAYPDGAAAEGERRLRRGVLRSIVMGDGGGAGARIRACAVPPFGTVLGSHHDALVEARVRPEGIRWSVIPSSPEILGHL